ncbi:fluoride efflux transporter FluC [Aureibacillus halotolerans]|uniref:Fluoride-specific ion channel FluC n=1 Tax=Aureibacillus halotolerans TaxID=1508390 RepID=A0A4R6UCB7_9BACI|nr:CrcB family protein [Aureibacillus halotolerans]TDQ42743.1 camphor resistance protein CrcB [Aureibacillus halotolerans]
MKVGLFVMLGGGVGALSRYGLMLLFTDLSLIATLTANISGSFLLPVLMLRIPNTWPQELKIALTTGMIGGYTTFSTFSFEVLTFFQHEEWIQGISYGSATFLICFVASAAGFAYGSKGRPQQRKHI